MRKAQVDPFLISSAELSSPSLLWDFGKARAEMRESRPSLLSKNNSSLVPNKSGLHYSGYCSHILFCTQEHTLSERAYGTCKPNTIR